jgi:hypothetical protein
MFSLPALPSTPISAPLSGKIAAGVRDMPLFFDDELHQTFAHAVSPLYEF